MGSPLRPIASASPSASRPTLDANSAVRLLVQALEHREAGRGRERVARQGARLVDGPERGQLRHEVAPASERGQRQATSDHLPEAPQVRLHAEHPGGPGAPDTKAGDHFVEDEQGPCPVASGAESFEIPATGATSPMFAATGSTMTHATDSSISGTLL